MHKASRPAQVGEELTTKNFGSGTVGFVGAAEADTAICLLPGTEIAFAEPAKTHVWGGIWQEKITSYGPVAIFRQINKDISHTHHDALEFPDGEVVLLTRLMEGQSATVLQLPAAPKNEAEALDQTRLEVVG